MNSRFKKTVAIFLFTIALTSGVLAPNSAYAYADMQQDGDVSTDGGFLSTIEEFFESLLNEITDVLTVPGG